MQINDEVVTMVPGDGIPRGTWEMVGDLDEDGIWVDVYI